MKKLTYFTAAIALCAGVFSVSAAPGRQAESSAGRQEKAVQSSDEPLVPNEVKDLKISWDMGRNGFDISFTAPTQGSYYDWNSWTEVYGDLASISKIEVSACRQNNGVPAVIHTFRNPAPGERLSYFEETLGRGGLYDFTITVFADGEQSEGFGMNGVLAGGVPAIPSDIKVMTTGGALPATLSFTAPSLYSDGVTPLEKIAKGELWTKGGWFDAPVFIAEILGVMPGQPVEHVIDNPGLTGEQNWTLTLYSEDGPSEKAPVNFYIGIDTPGKVSSFKADETEEGTVVLTWGVPETGSRGGYFDASQLSYDVKAYTPGSSWGDDCETLATDLADRTYTYRLVDGEPKKLRFSVTPRTDAGQGTETKGDYMVVGPALTLPFRETFDSRQSEYSYTYDHLWGASDTSGESNPPQWSVSEYCYDGSTKVTPAAASGAFAHLNTYSSTPASDFMLTSSKIAVDGAGTLDLSFSYYVSALPSGETSMSASIKFDNTSDFETVHTAVFEHCAAKGWQTGGMEGIPVPAGARTAQVRVTAHNSPEAVALAIDDVRLRAGEAVPDVYPASVSDFKAELRGDGSAIDISMTAPSLSHPSLGDVNDQPLTMISRISLQRQVGYATGYKQIHEFIAPQPGASLSYSDTDVAQGGEYSYKAVVYVGDKCDYGNYLDEPVTVGQIPGEVTGLTISCTRGAAPVTLSFRLPSSDIKGDELMEVKAVAINRYDNDTFVWDEIARLTEGVAPGAWMTWSDSDVRAGEIYEYRVACEGSAGNSYGVSQSVYVGFDSPETPSNLVAELGEDGFVHLTWDAPTRGVNNGYIDTEHLTYVVQRGNGYSDYDAMMLNGSVRETSFTDPTVFGEEEIVKYFVKAVSGQVSGYSAISNTLLVGNPAELPYTENFNTEVGGNIQPNSSSWTTDSTEPASNWAFAEMAYFVMEGQVTPVNSDGGLAYSFYGPYSALLREDRLTSGNINVTGAERPGLTYYVYGVQGYDTSLDVEVSFDGGEFRAVNSHDFYDDFDQEGWLKVEMPVNVPSGATKMRLRFVARKGEYSCSVAIDNVMVTREFEGSGVEGTAVEGACVRSEAGCIVVAGLDANDDVTVADLDGRVRYAGKGDCRLSLDRGVYLVRFGSDVIKVKN